MSRWRLYLRRVGHARPRGRPVVRLQLNAQARAGVVGGIGPQPHPGVILVVGGPAQELAIEHRKLPRIRGVEDESHETRARPIGHLILRVRDATGPGAFGT